MSYYELNKSISTLIFKFKYKFDHFLYFYQMKLDQP